LSALRDDGRGWPVRDQEYLFALHKYYRYVFGVYTLWSCWKEQSPDVPGHIVLYSCYYILLRELAWTVRPFYLPLCIWNLPWWLATIIGKGAAARGNGNWVGLWRCAGRRYSGWIGPTDRRAGCRLSWTGVAGGRPTASSLAGRVLEAWPQPARLLIRRRWPQYCGGETRCMLLSPTSALSARPLCVSCVIEVWYMINKSGSQLLCCFICMLQILTTVRTLPPYKTEFTDFLTALRIFLPTGF